MNPNQSISNTISIPGSVVSASASSQVTQSKFLAGYGHVVWGYILLFLGVSVMIYASSQTYGVYMKTLPIPAFFNFEGVKLDLSKLQPQMDSSGLEDMARRAGVTMPKMAQLPKMDPTEILPAAMINESSNLGAFIFFMGFAVNVGYKVASLGVKLIRPLYVKV